MMLLLSALLLAPVYARVTGDQFTGGAAATYGGTWFGERVNFVYAAPNGPLATMKAELELAAKPAGDVFLLIRARDDEIPAKVRIRIDFNGQTLFAGPNRFDSGHWSVMRFPVKPKTGANELVIANLEPIGKAGMPPWFMVAGAVLADGNYSWKPDMLGDFSIELPKTVRPFPEPLAKGQQPGFAIRGTKGWKWSPEQYLRQIPTLKKLRMNFLMNCYTSMCDVEHFRWGDPNVNRWWEPLPAAKKRAYEKVVRACQKSGIAFCFSMNPNLCSKRPLRYGSKADLEALWQHYAWMQSLGVHWFNVSLDDISEGIDAEGQVRVVNEMFRRLRAKDPGVHFIFCPTRYWGDGTDAESRPYLEVLARDLSPEIYLFWTGDQVYGPITLRAAKSYRAIVRHRVFLWDNYPVNDDNPTMHLGPVVEREAGIERVLDGYMGNPMCRQDQANRIPLSTCADYAYNPSRYDPVRSIGQAILHLAADPAHREALRRLVEAYPGLLILKSNSGFNPVRDHLAKILAQPHSRYLAEMYVREMTHLAPSLPADFPDARQTLLEDVAWMKGEMKSHYGG